MHSLAESLINDCLPYLMTRMKDAEARLEHTAVSDDDLLGARSAAGANRFDGLDNLHSLDNLPEHDMLAIEMRGVHSGDEELGSVGAGSSVGHGEKADSVVTKLKVFVGELCAVDGLTTTARALGEVTALEHEVRDDTVEDAVLVVKRLAHLSNTLLTSAKCTEVLGSLGDNVVTENKLDSASGATANAAVKKDLRAAVREGGVACHVFAMKE